MVMADDVDIDELAAEAVQAMRRYVEALVAREIARLDPGGDDERRPQDLTPRNRSEGRAKTRLLPCGLRLPLASTPASQGINVAWQPWEESTMIIEMRDLHAEAGQHPDLRGALR